jgi:diacylglycerol O-acyltransferase / trehalose O-mycolyltransferase
MTHLTRRGVLGRALVLTGAIAADGIVNALPAHAASSSFVAADDGAQIISTSTLDSRMLDLTVSSPALGTTAPVRLILPTNWSSTATRTWPVLYLLQGAHDDYTSWTRETDVESFTAGHDVIVAMPSGGPTGFATTWWNSGADNPNYETFQLVELAQLLQRNYKASTVRAVGGASTGGYAALAQAARHPGAFTFAASYSGITDTTFLGMPPIVVAILLRENLNPLSLWGDFFLQNSIWRAFNPYDQAASLRGTGLYISQGSGLTSGGTVTDPSGEILEYLLWPSAQAMAALLQLLGVSATTHLYQGGVHNWSSWQPEFHTSWPLIASSLGIS